MAQNPQTQSTSPDPANKRQEIMSRIVVKTWTDPAFKKRLLASPHDVLRDEGLTLPPGNVRIVFHEDNTTERHFVIPAPPAALNLSATDLTQIAAQRLAIQLELF
jgi:hypothetical protein